MSWAKKMQGQKIESIKYDSSKNAKYLAKEYGNTLNKIEKATTLSEKKSAVEEFLNKNFPDLDEEVRSNLISEIAEGVDKQLANNPTVVKNLQKAGLTWEMIKQLKAYSLGLDSPNVGIGSNFATTTTSVVETANGPELQTNSTIFSGLLTGGINSVLVAWDYQNQIDDGADIEDAALKTAGHFGIGLGSAQIAAAVTAWIPGGPLVAAPAAFVVGTIISYFTNKDFDSVYDHYLEPVVEDAKNYLLDERNHNIGSKAYLDKLGLEQK